jgi:hypothetical protein
MGEGRGETLKERRVTRKLKFKISHILGSQKRLILFPQNNAYDDGHHWPADYLEKL